MGGISTTAVDCGNYAEAEKIDADITAYIVEGLQPEGELFIYYSWYRWAMYVWNLNTQSYTNTIQAILDCGISGEVSDSVYANQDYIDGKWNPGMERMQAIFDILDLWWAPWIMILF